MALVPAIAQSPNTAERTVDGGTLAPGETTTVTLKVSFNEPTNVTVVETISPAPATVELVSATGADFAAVNDANTEVFATWGGVESATLVYELTVPEAATDGTIYQLGSTDTSDIDLGTDTITVERQSAPGLQVAAVQPDPVVVAEGESFDVEATVTNPSGTPVSDTIELVVDGSVLATTTVDVAPGANETVRFEDVPTDGLSVGQYTYVIRAGTDQADGHLDVERHTTHTGTDNPSPTPTEGDAPTATASPSSTDGPLPTDTPGPSRSGDGDGTPGFSLVAGLLALLGVALLSRRR